MKREEANVMYNIVKSIEIEQCGTSVCTFEVRLTMTNDTVRRPQIFLLLHTWVFARLYFAIYASLKAPGLVEHFKSDCALRYLNPYNNIYIKSITHSI